MSQPPARRMAPELRREQIIDAALGVFAEKGFSGATNRDLARAAGLRSSGLIYHYFASKAELLQAVFERHAPPLRLIQDRAALMEVPPRIALTQLGRAYLSLLEDAKRGAFFRLMLTEALRDPEFARTFGALGPLRVIDVLTEYMAAQMDAGHLRRMDPRIAVRCFIGPIMTSVLMRHVLRVDPERDVDADALLSEAVELFLRGSAPEPS